MKLKILINYKNYNKNNKENTKLKIIFCFLENVPELKIEQLKTWIWSKSSEEANQLESSEAEIGSV